MDCGPTADYPVNGISQSLSATKPAELIFCVCSAKDPISLQRGALASEVHGGLKTKSQDGSDDLPELETVRVSNIVLARGCHVTIVLLTDEKRHTTGGTTRRANDEPEKRVWRYS